MMILFSVLSFVHDVIPPEDKYNSAFSFLQIDSKMEIAPAKMNFLIKDRKQILEHCLPGISNITSFYLKIAVANLPSQAHQTPHRKKKQMI